MRKAGREWPARCASHGSEVRELTTPAISEELSGKFWVEAPNPQWFVYSNEFKRSQTGVFLDRCFDIAFGLLLTLLASPLPAAIAIAIKVDSEGPALFRQVRTGLHGRTLVMYKFRSMRHDAESAAGPVWVAEWDEDRKSDQNREAATHSSAG
jgi:lipopolysaccharide/colanic/teichoic acid biosynthesis glycosyltransferase